MPDQFNATVRVMRSYDYSHFEITLGSETPLTLVGVDALRKEAARLADKAVEQFKIAKGDAERRLSDNRQRAYAVQDAERIRDKPEGERTVNEVAELKAFDDFAWEARRPYDYEDEWDTEESED